MAVDLFALRMNIQTTGLPQAQAGLQALNDTGVRTATSIHGTTNRMAELNMAAAQQAANTRALVEAKVRLSSTLNRISGDVAAATTDFKAGRLSATDYATAMSFARGEATRLGSATHLNKEQLKQYDGILKQTAGSIVAKTSALSALMAPLKAIGILYVATKVLGFAHDTITAAGALHEMAQKTGASVEMLSVLKFAGAQAGVSVEMLAMGFRGLSMSLGGLRDGNEKVAEAFARLGLSAQDFKGLNVDQSFLKILERINQLPDGFEKSEAAVRIFGRAGAQLLPLLAELGERGFANVRMEAEKLGAVISAESARKADAFTDAMARMKSALGGLFKDVLMPLLPALTGFVGLLALTVRHINTLASGGIANFGFALGRDLANARGQGDFSEVVSGGSSTGVAGPNPVLSGGASAPSRVPGESPAARRARLLGVLDAEAAGSLAGGGMLGPPLQMRGGSAAGGATGVSFAGPASAADAEAQRRFEILRDWAERVKLMAKGLDKTFGQVGANLGMTLANGFASAMAAGIQGKNIFKAFGNAVLSGLGSIFTQMGSELLAYGVIMLNLLPFLSNPFTSGPAAIAAGAALVALGTVLGGIATGPGGGGGGGGSQASRDRTTQITLTADGAGGFKAPKRTEGPTYNVIGTKDPRAARMFGELSKTAGRANHG